MTEHEWELIVPGVQVFEVVASYSIRTIECVGAIPANGGTTKKIFFNKGDNETLIYCSDVTNIFLEENKALVGAISAAESYLRNIKTYVNQEIIGHKNRLAQLEANKYTDFFNDKELHYGNF